MRHRNIYSQHNTVCGLCDRYALIEVNLPIYRNSSTRWQCNRLGFYLSDQDGQGSLRTNWDEVGAIHNEALPIVIDQKNTIVNENPNVITMERGKLKGSSIDIRLIVPMTNQRTLTQNIKTYCEKNGWSKLWELRNFNTLYIDPDGFLVTYHLDHLNYNDKRWTAKSKGSQIQLERSDYKVLGSMSGGRYKIRGMAGDSIKNV